MIAAAGRGLWTVPWIWRGCGAQVDSLYRFFRLEIVGLMLGEAPFLAVVVPAKAASVDAMTFLKASMACSASLCPRRLRGKAQTRWGWMMVAF